MKFKYLYVRSLIALSALAFVACATPAKAPLSADANPEIELNRASAAIEDASRQQYDRLAPNHFQRAVDFRNSAKEKLAKGADRAKVLNDISVSLEASNQVEVVGRLNSGNMRNVLEARKNAVNAEAAKFQEKEFREADKELGFIGEKLEAGNYRMDAEELTDIEKKFSLAEIGARRHTELGTARAQISRAAKDGAKSKTPNVYESAAAKMAAAEQAIGISPHSTEGYSAQVSEAKREAQKLSEVLAIARSKNASESVALTIWNQQQALIASRAALTDAKEASETERAQMERALAAKDDRLERQTDSIDALKSQNTQYASEEELKQKIEEIKQTFAEDEAEVMKDGKNLVVRLKNMKFSTGRAEVNPDSFATLRKVDTLIAAVPVTRITVEGHTDSTGGDTKNKALSKRRAESVKKYLLSQGVSESLPVDTAGYGSNRPLTSNKTKNGRAINRRVDIVIETPATL